MTVWDREWRQVEWELSLGSSNHITVIVGGSVRLEFTADEAARFASQLLEFIQLARSRKAAP